jgi:iron complex transport system substrate-binding protein
MAAIGLMAWGQASWGYAKPQRVMSMNSCTDQLVMMLLPLNRITSVTYLAEGAAVTPQLADKIRQAPINHGLSEELLAQKPDLLFTEAYSTPPARKLAQQAGTHMIVVDAAESFDDIRRITRQVATVVGEPARGEALIHQMDETLAELKRTQPAHRIRALMWDAYGRVPSKHSLFDAILTAAGGVNPGAANADFDTSMDIERLLALAPQPDLLLYGSSSVSQPTLRSAVVQHPVLRRRYANRRLAIPEYQCGTPEAANQALALRRQMLRALGQAGIEP